MREIVFHKVHEIGKFVILYQIIETERKFKYIWIQLSFLLLTIESKNDQSFYLFVLN